MAAIPAKGAVHKGRPQRVGRVLVKCRHLRTGGGGKRPCGRLQAGAVFFIIPACFADTLYG